MSSAQLARRSFVSPQAANEMVTTLERRASSGGSCDSEGGRALSIHLTALGERTLAQCDEQVDVLETQLFGEVSRKEETQFRQMLRTCREAMRGRPADAVRREDRGA